MKHFSYTFLWLLVKKCQRDAHFKVASFYHDVWQRIETRGNREE